MKAVRRSKKLWVLIGIGVLIIASSSVFYLYDYNRPVIPENIHHYQVIANDTFGIGEKHGSANP